MSRLRDLARRAAPPQLRAAVRQYKKVLQGPAFFEVELGDYRFLADPSERPRLTLVLPSILRRTAFGGITTGVEFYFGLAQALRARGPLDLRVLVTNPEDARADTVLDSIARQFEGLDPAEIDIQSRCYKGSQVATRAREIFIPFNWTCAGNLRGLLRAQKDTFGGALRPFVYPIQEYEPGFYPFSSDQLLAREVYDDDWPVFAVVNSSQLASWLDRQGHDFTRVFVFKPQLSQALRPHLGRARTATRKRRILVYGRQAEDRNCFSILRAGLQIWARRFPDQADWQVVSAGTPHKPIALPGGRKVVSVGKLSLDDYATMLCETAVGVSLMASPHPSYPPLEMAHFGLRTITNGFGDIKDLSRAHDNIVSLTSVRPENLAQTLAEACRAFEADPGLGARGRSHMPGYLEGDPFPFLSDLADALQPVLR